MSNNKQSSVEWLQAIELERDLTLADWNKAKEMHMQEICDAHYYGQESDRMADTWNDHPEYWACEYYLKKFNNQQ